MEVSAAALGRGAERPSRRSGTSGSIIVGSMPPATSQSRTASPATRQRGGATSPPPAGCPSASEPVAHVLAAGTAHLGPASRHRAGSAHRPARYRNGGPLRRLRRADSRARARRPSASGACRRVRRRMARAHRHPADELALLVRRLCWARAPTSNCRWSACWKAVAGGRAGAGGGPRSAEGGAPPRHGSERATARSSGKPQVDREPASQPNVTVIDQPAGAGTSPRPRARRTAATNSVPPPGCHRGSACVDGPCEVTAASARCRISSLEIETPKAGRRWQAPGDRSRERSQVGS